MPEVDSNFIKRIQPHNEEAERSVLGSMLMDRDAITEAEGLLVKEDFYHRQYGILFEAMLELYREGKQVDLVTLQNRLRGKDIPEAYASPEFFRDLVEEVPTSANVGSYAKIVHDKATLRELIRVTENIGNDCYLAKEDTQEILEKTETDIFNSRQFRSHFFIQRKIHLPVFTGDQLIYFIAQMNGAVFTQILNLIIVLIEHGRGQIICHGLLKTI